MRTLLAVFSLLCSFLLIGSFFALYYWVPGLKTVIEARGTPVTSGELLLINLSNFTVNYFYLVLPLIGLASYAAWQVAFAEESKSPRAES